MKFNIKLKKRIYGLVNRLKEEEMIALIKKLPGYQVLNRIWYFSTFFLRALKVRFMLTPIDHKSPFDGKLSTSGVLKFELTPASLTQLKDKAKNTDISLKIVLEKRDSEVIKEIFDELKETVRQYFGPNSYLDGIAWMLTKSSNTRDISSNWHTDNVGNRLKVFICVEGDGSQPTLVIPSSNRIPTTLKWIKYTFMESLRWAGISTKFNMPEEISCAHKDGSVYVFDTQLFHRGGYDKGDGDRLIFQMEFSNPLKHKLVNGPIGTKEYNHFSFQEELLQIESFDAMLNESRLHRDKTGYINYESC